MLLLKVWHVKNELMRRRYVEKNAIIILQQIKNFKKIILILPAKMPNIHPIRNSIGIFVSVYERSSKKKLKRY